MPLTSNTSPGFGDDLQSYEMPSVLQNTDREPVLVNLSIFSSLDISVSRIFHWEHDPLVLCGKQPAVIGSIWFLGIKMVQRRKVKRPYVDFFFFIHWSQNRNTFYKNNWTCEQRNTPRTLAIWNFGKNRKWVKMAAFSLRNTSTRWRLMLS